MSAYAKKKKKSRNFQEQKFSEQEQKYAESEQKNIDIDSEKEDKEELDVHIGNSTCQPMEVGVWVKKMKHDEMEEFIEFMESLGFKYIDYSEPNKKELRGKIYIIFFSYNSCQVCRIANVERPLSLDPAMLEFINSRFNNKIIDYHNINPRCDYIKSKEEKGVLNIDGGGN